MANKKITLQHLYTTGTTAAPAASALTLGEIAISARKDKEGIYFKNTNDEVVGVLTSAQTRTMILETAGSLEGFNDHIEHLANNREASEGNNPYGHVKLVDGDLSGKYQNYNEAGDGVAASAYHFHKQYYSFLDSGKGLTTIIGNEENGHPNEIGFGIDDVTYNKITGATPSSTFNSHTATTDMHVTKEQKDAWSTAANRINTFLDVETGATQALDSLHEIQEYLTGSGNSVTTLLESLNNLTDTVENNTSAITQNRNNISLLATSASTNATNITSLGQTIGQLTTNVSAINNKIGSGFTSNTITSEIESIKNNYITSISGDNKNLRINEDTNNKYTITHTSAGTQASAITATNDTTGLSFGSEFNIVDKIGYDANGHVVSGSTKTLKLPILPTGTTTNHGVVKLSNTTYENETAALAGGWSTLVGAAASIIHTHSQYVKFTDLEEYSGTTPLVISCGTY